MPKLKPNEFKIGNHLLTEQPILFQTEMVQANLEGRKTQTRRKCRYQHWSYSDLNDININRITQKADKGVSSPYGKPGDLLWVRETSFYAENLFPPQKPRYVYKADYGQSIGIRWKPSIHMPKSAARLWLMVEDIRVERVQDISDKDAISEGIGKVEINHATYFKRYDGYAKTTANPVVSFWSLWASINGEDSWEANPWVWVIQYRILSKTGRPSEKTILHNFLNIVEGEKNYMTI